MEHAPSQAEPDRRHLLSRLVRVIEVVLALWSIPTVSPGFGARSAISALAVVASSLAGCAGKPASQTAPERDVPVELAPVPELEAAFEAVGISDGSRVILYGGMGGLAAARAFFTLDILGETRRLKDRESLRAMFEGVGARPERTVVVYCTVGLRSSFGYFVGRYLGYETKMYDGSFSDWSRRADFPIER